MNTDTVLIHVKGNMYLIVSRAEFKRVEIDSLAFLEKAEEYKDCINSIGSEEPMVCYHALLELHEMLQKLKASFTELVDKIPFDEGRISPN